MIFGHFLDTFPPLGRKQFGAHLPGEPGLVREILFEAADGPGIPKQSFKIVDPDAFHDGPNIDPAGHLVGNVGMAQGVDADFLCIPDPGPFEKTFPVMPNGLRRKRLTRFGPAENIIVRIRLFIESIFQEIVVYVIGT